MAEPRVHPGNYYEIDACTFKQEEDGAPTPISAQELSGGLETAAQAFPAPTLTVDAEFPEQHAYEVLVFETAGLLARATPANLALKRHQALHLPGVRR